MNRKSEWQARAQNVLAQGQPGTNSKRASQYVEGVYPTHSNGIGIGAYLLDSEGKRYLDFIGALGTLILGYSHPSVVQAVQRQAACGASHSLPTTLEVETAERISALIPAAEKIRFLKTGNEATLAAIRIARAATGRSEILTAGYHGHGDLFTSLTPPALGVSEIFHIDRLEPWYIPNDPLEDKRDPNAFAAVIVEPVELEMTEARKDYLQALREWCTRHGIVLIFDEVITGMRVPQFSISNYWGIEPDMIILGKALANGWPLSVVAGKKEIMDKTEYFVSSTFSGEATSLAACLATLKEIETKKSLKDLMFYGQRLQDKLNALHPDIQFSGYGTRAMLNTTNPTTGLFMQEACKAGILFGKAHFFHFAHLEANIESFVLNICEGIVEQIKAGRVKLEGEIPKETFKR